MRSAIGAVLGAAVSCLCHASPEVEWQTILSLDAGPKHQPGTPAEARETALRHLALQRSALEEFLEKYPTDPRAPEARMRLAAVLAASGMTGPDPRHVRRALQLYKQVEEEPSLPAKLRSDAAFRRASLLMQAADQTTSAGRAAIVRAARAFHRGHPGDIRGPRMLVEASTVCDHEPELKKALLEEARQATQEKPLLARIEDDLRRLEYLGKPLVLNVAELRGGQLDLMAMRGKPLLLIFWSSKSPHSLLWLREFRQEWARAPRRPGVVTISLDPEKSAAIEKSQFLPEAWLVGWEPGGWNSPTARRLGINALPTVWLLDAEGRVVSLNARTGWSRQLAATRR